MAVAMKDAIRATVNDPKNSTNSDVRSAYQIARMIRNAFAHAPDISARWILSEFDRVFSLITKSDVLSHHEKAYASEPTASSGR
jgi:hypothetical protein